MFANSPKEKRKKHENPTKNNIRRRKKKRKIDISEVEAEKSQTTFTEELAQLAVDDPELYEFLKKEETDLFEERESENDDQQMNNGNEQDELEEDEFGSESNDEKQDLKSFPDSEIDSGLKLIKYHVRNWSQHNSEEAFVALRKISRSNRELFPVVFKSCYVAYVANCKRVEDDTLTCINFMQRTFTELTFVHPNIAYQYAFVYIRQFAIHLRTAIIAKRKDLVQTVYNWQFLKGLQLWVCVICGGIQRYQSSVTTAKNGQQQTNWFQEMAHPLIEIISIMERLFPSIKFLPLRIHCLQMLLMIQNKCDVFMPTFAYTIELLQELIQINAKKPKSGKGPTKGIHLEKMLRLSNEQLDEADVRMHLAEQLFSLANDSLELLKSREERSWQQIVIPIAVKLRHFLKTCANREHVRLFAQLKAKMDVADG